MTNTNQCEQCMWSVETDEYQYEGPSSTLSCSRFVEGYSGCPGLQLCSDINEDNVCPYFEQD